MLAPAWSSRPLSLRTVRPSAFLGPPGPCWELGSQVAQSRPMWMVSVPPQGLGCGRRPGQSGLVQRLGFAVADTFLTGLRAPWQSSGRVRMAAGTLESLSPSGPPVCTSPSSSDAGAGLRQLGGGRGLRVSRCSDRVSGRVAGWQLLRPGLDPSCSPARLRAFFSAHRPAALRPPGAQQRQDSTAREAGGKAAPGGGAGGRGCARRPCCTGTVLAPRSQDPRPDPVFFLSPFFFCLQTARSAEWSPRAANAPVSQPPGVFCRTNSFVKIC